jgi:large subunit ribosomal protein L17
MRHRVGHRKLGRITPHRTALLRNLATALFERERIRTTLMKAKELRPYAEKLITLAKRDDDRRHARRLAARDIHDHEVLRKLFDTLGARYATRPGGYTRILRLGPRRGDGAEMAILELLGSEYQPGKADGKAADKAKAKDATPKAKAAKPKSDKPKAEKSAKADAKGGHDKKKGSAKAAGTAAE